MHVWAWAIRASRHIPGSKGNGAQFFKSLLAQKRPHAPGPSALRFKGAGICLPRVELQSALFPDLERAPPQSAIPYTANHALQHTQDFSEGGQLVAFPGQGQLRASDQRLPTGTQGEKRQPPQVAIRWEVLVAFPQRSEVGIGEHERARQGTGLD